MTSLVHPVPIPLCFFLFLLSFFSFGSLTATESDVFFLRGLIDRGLFESVDYFCTKEFQKADEPTVKKLALATELLRSRTGQMLQESPARQKEIYQSFDDIENRFLKRTDRFFEPTEFVAEISLSFQRAIGEYSYGNWLRLDADVSVSEDRTEKQRQARQILLRSLDHFTLCLENIASLRKKAGQAADLALEQKTNALERNIRFQQGLAQMSYALTFPDIQNKSGTSDNLTEANGAVHSDRSFSLNRAIEILNEIASLRIADPIVVRSKIELATCYRLLGNLQRCQEILVQLHRNRSADNKQFQAELIRYSVAVGDLDTALENVRQADSDSNVYPDYDLAKVELLLALSKRLRDQTQNQETKQQEEQLSDTLLKTIQNIEKSFGPYWGRRARILFSTAEDNEQARNQVDPRILVLLAKDRFQTGHHAEAVELFDQASRSYELAGDPEKAFASSRSSLAVLVHVYEKAVGSTTVSDEDKLKCRRRLIDRIRNVSTRFFVQKEAGELHLKAIDLAAEDLVEQKTTTDQYLDLLREHIGTWPDSAKVPPLTLRAGLLLEQQGKQRDSLDMLARISNKDQNALKAIAAACRCFDEMDSSRENFETLENKKQESKTKFLLQKAKWFEFRLPNEQTPWNEADGQSALHAAESYFQAALQIPDLKDKNKTLQQAEFLLQSALKRGTQNDAGQKAPFLSLLVTTLNEMNKKEEANRLLQTFNDDSFSRLTPEEQLRFKQVQARLKADTGSIQEAVDLLNELLKQDPKNLSNWKLLAEILSNQLTPETQVKAMQVWAKIERAAPKGSEFWWSAREGIIDVLLKQNKIEEARKSCELLRVLYPDLGGAERKQRLNRKLKL